MSVVPITMIMCIIVINPVAGDVLMAEYPDGTVVPVPMSMPVEPACICL